MRHSSADRRRRAGRALAPWLLVLLLPCVVLGQDEAEESVRLAATTQRTLVRLQEDWLRWLSASYRENGEAATVVLESLLATGEELEFERFPDLSQGALQQAARAAREGDFGRAEWILDTAERLDPGRPETLFAKAYVAREGGGLPAVIAAEAGGFLRIFRHPLERRLWINNAIVWLFWVLMLAGAAFVFVLFVAHGPQLYEDLAALITGSLPVMVLPVVIPLLLLAPLSFPGGLIWLLCFWAALLWAYSSNSARMVLVFTLALTVAVPVVLSTQRAQLELAFSPSARALSALTEARLYGGLFKDLENLREQLPGEPAILHLEADLHQRIGQSRTARDLYRRVLETEPENGAVLNNLGVQYFHQADFGNAINFFQRAASAAPRRAEPAYNLSQAYSQSFSFDESNRAIQDAKNRDNNQVEQWIAESRSALLVEGGRERMPEIREKLAANRPVSESHTASFAIGLAVFVGTIVLALAWNALRQNVLPGVRFGKSVPSANRWILALVPGAGAAEVGAGFQAYLAVLLPVALLALPASRGLGHRIPWGFEPPGVVAWAIAILGLGLIVAWKVRAIVKEGV